MNCEKCNHEHAGVKLAYICVGCPCPERPEPPDAANEGDDPEGDAACCVKHEQWHGCAGCLLDDELEDVVGFLRRHEADQILGIKHPNLSELIDALKRGEHRR